MGAMEGKERPLHQHLWVAQEVFLILPLLPPDQGEALVKLVVMVLLAVEGLEGLEGARLRHCGFPLF